MRCVLATGLMLVVAAGDLCASAAIQININKETGIIGDSILLGDITTATGEPVDTIRRLHTVFIGKSPLPGKSRTVTRDAIRTRIRQNGFDLAAISITGFPEARVSRQYQEVAEGQIESVVRSFMEARLLAEYRSVRIKHIHVSHGARLPAGNLTYQIKPLDRQQLRRKIPVHVNLFADRVWIKKILVIVEIEIIENAVVARRSLKKGHIITADDILVKHMDVSDLPSNILTDESEVLGKRVRKPIGALQVLRTDMAEQPPILRRGDIVQIIAESERLRVSTMGMVKGLGGSKGDRIRVMNIDSNKGVYARILDARTVVVDY